MPSPYLNKSPPPLATRHTPLSPSPPLSLHALSPLSSLPPVLSVTTGVTLLLTYHLRLHKRESKSLPTWRTSQVATRLEWSRHVRKTESWLYAVQTLRNAITAQTFLATTVLSLLTVISGRMWDLVLKTPRPCRARVVAQFVTVAVCMLISAHEFLQSARLMTHAGFMFPVAGGPSTVLQPESVDRVISRSQTAQWLGLRWLYLSINAVVWVVGGEGPFLLACVAFVRFFDVLDRPPNDGGE